MKLILAALVASTLTAAPSTAADKPNFSGSWTMNVARSSFGPLPPPDSITRKIAHEEPSIAIDEEQLTPFGVTKANRKYTTDGKETTFESQGAQVATNAVWNGEVLVVTSNVTQAGLQFVDRMTLSADGKTLTSEVHIVSPQGDADMKVVFEKQ
jgi:hypothetical protein